MGKTAKRPAKRAEDIKRWRYGDAPMSGLQQRVFTLLRLSEPHFPLGYVDEILERVAEGEAIAELGARS